MPRHPRLLPGLGALLLATACTPNVAAPPPTPGASTSAAPSVLPSSGPSGAPTAAPSDAASPSAAPSAAPAGFALTGQVLDDKRDFVVGATVTARQAGKDVASATVGNEGSYALSLPAGTYDVSATKAGFTTRTQAITVAAAATLHFGQETSSSTNPFAISDTPEIEKVDVDEAAAGGPLTLKVRFSEPLPEKSQQRFDQNVELRVNRTTEFLRTTGLSGETIKPERSWEDEGRTFVFKYAGGYLPSGATPVDYSLMIPQEQDEDERDPETRELVWDDLGIADAAGNALGRGRMQFAFLKLPLYPFDVNYLVNRDFGYYVEDRRWRLTHDGFFTFTAKKDDVPPALEKVSLEVRDKVGGKEADVLTLTFSEPMRTAKDRLNPEFTRLDVDRDMAFLSVSTSRDGANPTQVDKAIKIREIEFNRDDPSIVYFHYPPGLFEDKEWVEVTLGQDVQDPAGNKSDPKKFRLSGPVTGG